MSESPVLVTGGAGYIGSHAVLALLDAGRSVVVLDNLSTGERAAVPDTAVLEVADVGNAVEVARLLSRYGIREVLHFAGSVRVDESVADPVKYYANNTAASCTLIAACLKAGVKRFVFSSTAATYGIPAASPVDETATTEPINPYGWSKLMTERMLRDVAAAGGPMSVAILRYFNVAGADPGGRAGQRTRNATHLIKVASEVASGRRPEMEIFGTDYETRDGTCVRDYIHVTDLAEAHLEVLKWIEDNGPLALFNCGYGRGYTVREVLAVVERVSGTPLATREAGRRRGDPPELVADAHALKERVGWRPRLADLDTIVRTALTWERRSKHITAVGETQVTKF